MACKTCDHTVQGLGDGWWWCSRCGSSMHRVGQHEDWGVPSVVDRAQAVIRRTLEDGLIGKEDRDLAEAVGLLDLTKPAVAVPKEYPLDTIDGKIAAADLTDEVDRKMLRDAFLEAGRDEEAESMQTHAPQNLVKGERQGRLEVWELPF